MVQVMTCRLYGSKPLPEPMLLYCQLDHWEQTSVKYKSKYKAFIQENAFENVVCEMAVILSRGWWVLKLLEYAFAYNLCHVCRFLVRKEIPLSCLRHACLWQYIEVRTEWHQFLYLYRWRVFSGVVWYYTALYRDSSEIILCLSSAYERRRYIVLYMS